jgi:hypothetical protein
MVQGIPVSKSNELRRKVFNFNPRLPDRLVEELLINGKAYVVFKLDAVTGKLTMERVDPPGAQEYTK